MRSSASGGRNGALLELDLPAETTPSADPLSNVLGYRLRRAHMRMAAHCSRWLADVGLPLTPVQGGLLLLVDGNPDIQQAALARLLNIEAPTLSQALAPLFEAGFLARKRAEGDGRASTLLLTGTGKAAAEQVRAETPGQEAAALAPLTPVERAELLRLLDKVLRHEPSDRAATPVPGERQPRNRRRGEG
jgi:DNA-binding MarR family transcriptional regulator